MVPGKILDLSLGGCCVKSALPIQRGERAEIVVRVNAASFRVLGEVRAVRDGSGTCIEFVQLSARGKDLLGDLVTDLAKLQTVMNKLKSARRDMDEESFRKQLEYGEIQSAWLDSRSRFLETIPAEDSKREEAAEAGKNLAGLIVPVNLFG